MAVHDARSTVGQLGDSAGNVADMPAFTEPRPHRLRKRLKRTFLDATKKLGVFAAVRDGRWRSRRILILSYHGISLADEHEWHYGLYMKPADFRERLQLLRRGGYTVLSLGLALELLRANDLPPKSVVITFDDGFYDFYKCAYPILSDFAYPATVYLTTYYCGYNRPVFDVICSYLLWKGRGMMVDRKGIMPGEGKIDLRTPAGRDHALALIQDFARSAGLTSGDKDALAATLAARVKVDYDAILARRILHLMKPEEVRQLSAENVDIQLHTHRHRTPSNRAAFIEELLHNRESIVSMIDATAAPSHFCYPSGVHKPEFLPWLEEAGVISATTCAAGMTSRRSHPLLLPRLLDSDQLAPVEFESWLTGVAAFLPRWPGDRS